MVIGFAISAILLLKMHPEKPDNMPQKWMLYLAGFFIGLMALDGFTSYVGIRTTTNSIRLITGMMAGYALPVFILPILNNQLWKKSSSARLLEESKKFLIWLLVLPLAFLFVWFQPHFFGYLMPHIAFLGVMVQMVVINLLILTTMPVFSQRYQKVFEMIPLFIIGPLIIVEIFAAYQFNLFMHRLH